MAGSVILIADDSAFARAVARDALEARGHRVLEAGDGMSALARCRAERPDVVLVDRELPRLDGFGVLGALRGEPQTRDTPVVVISGAGPHAQEDVSDALARGAHDCLRRPFDAAELIARVHAALRVGALRRELRRRGTELERATALDPLTGLPSRAHALERLRAHVATGGPVALALVDVDGMRLLNEAHGEDAGEDVLAVLAGRTRAAARGDDVVARWDGDQLAVVLPHAGAADVALVAERVRAAVAAEPLATGGGAVRATVSVGWSASDGELAAHEVLRTAEAALAAAKGDGRNVVRGPSA